MIRSLAIALIAAPCLVLAGASFAATTTGQKAGTAAAAKPAAPCDTRSKTAKCKQASAAKSSANTASQKAPPPAKPREPEPRESDQSGAGAAS